ncbi:MAG: hypothetical protein NT062_06295 [Proteobacteria bacterium]|nr:hypothetical protein [Pseudomonadota bacterium]
MPSRTAENRDIPQRGTQQWNEDHSFFLGAKAKLTIGSLDDPGLQVVAQYNPRELEIKKAHSWKDLGGTSKQIDSAELEYTGPAPATLAIELLFDGYETQGKIGQRSIMQLIATIERMAAPRDPTQTKDAKRRPHHCIVAWGKGKDRPADCMPNFPCVIESIHTKYQLFSSVGSVLRATCTVQLKQCNRIDKGERLDEEIVEWFRRG